MNIAYILTAAAAIAQQVAPSAVAPEAASADVLVLPAGTEIELMVLREVDSDRAKPGDPVKLRVNSPVMVGETVVVPIGAAAQGEVTATRRSGGLLRSGNLAINITSVTLGGRSIPLGTSLEQKARGGKSDDFWKVALAPAWLLFARGNSAKLKAGELLTAQVDASICFVPGEGGYVPAECPDNATAKRSATSS